MYKSVLGKINKLQKKKTWLPQAIPVLDWSISKNLLI
jgi:hypothetical protein